MIKKYLCEGALLLVASIAWLVISFFILMNYLEELVLLLPKKLLKRK